VEDKKRYYGLDEIGFLGTQDKRTDAQIKNDIRRTIQHIKAKKNAKAGAASLKKSSLSKN